MEYEWPLRTYEDLVKCSYTELCELGFIPCNDGINGRVFWHVRREWLVEGDVPASFSLFDRHDQLVGVWNASEELRKDEDPNPLIFSPYVFYQNLYCIQISWEENSIVWLGEDKKENVDSTKACTFSLEAVKREKQRLKPVMAKIWPASALYHTIPVVNPEVMDSEIADNLWDKVRELNK